MEKDKWEVGDIAICIDVNTIVPGNAPSLKLYGEYVVNGIFVCSCGSLKLDVGLVSLNKIGTLCKCGSVSPASDIHWCNSKRFVKKQTKEMVQMELNAAVDAENYELAQILKERLEAV